MARIIRILLAAALIAPVLALHDADRAAAQSGGCHFAINGFDIADFGNASRAIEVDATTPLAIAIVYPRAVGDVSAEVDVGPIIRTFTVRQTEKAPNADWNGVLDLSPQQSRAVGLQRILFQTSDGCQAVTWVKLTGQSPFTTVFGILAMAFAFAGLATIAWSLRAALRGGHVLVPAIIGPVLLGIGLALLAQELAFSPLSTGWIVLWMVLPLSFSLAISMPLARRYKSRHPSDDDDEDDDEYDISDASYAPDNEAVSN